MLPMRCCARSVPESAVDNGWMTEHTVATAWHAPALQRASRVVLALLIVVVSWLAWSPAPPPEATSGWDKLDHFAAFGALAFVAVLGFGWHARLRIALALLGYGVLIEFVQAFIPTRTAEAMDVLADGVGITLGLAATRLILRLAQKI